MPVQFGPQETGALANIAGGFGSGLSAGLQNLIDMKLQDYARQQQAQRFATGLSGLFPQEQAALLSQLNPEQLTPIVREQARAQRQLQTTGPGLKTIAPELSEDQASKIGRLPASVQNLWFKEYQDNPNAAIDRLNSVPDNFGNKQVQKFAKELQSAAKQEPLSRELLNATQQQQLQQIGATKASIPSALSQEIQPIIQQPQPILSNIQPTSQLPLTVEESLTPKIKNISERLKEDPTLSRKEAEKLVSADIKARSEEEKVSREYYKDTEKVAAASNGFDKRLNRMSKLIEEGSIPISSFYNTFKSLSEEGIGSKLPLVGSLVDLTSKILGSTGRAVQKGITSTDTDEFEKLTNDFVREAKEVFGGRVAVAEMQQFLASIPNLSMTDNGKRAVIRNMKNFNQASRIKADAAKEIVDANKGRVPPNLEALVERKVKAQLDKLAEDFVNGVNTDASNPSIQFPWQQILNPPETIV